MNTFYTLLNNNPGLTLACGSNGKENSCNAGDLPGFNPSVRKIPWRREWLPTSAFSPGEFHGQRSLADYSPWGHKESPREGNGYPLQYFCLENSMDRGAWWATVHGVTRSQIQLNNSFFFHFTTIIKVSLPLFYQIFKRNFS